MLTESDLSGELARQALRFIRRGRPYSETVAFLEDLQGQDAATLADVEEIGLLIENYMLQNPPPEPSEIQAELEAGIRQVIAEALSETL